MASLPNIVLVHGAWADGSSWSNVITPLQNAGYRVTAVQLPLTSVEDDVAFTRHVLTLQEGPTVLVAHSYGGVVITQAATGAANVTGLVYIAAYVPDEGETLLDLNGHGPDMPALANLRPDDHGFVWFDQAAFPGFFAPDVDPAQARVMAAVQKPNAGSAFSAKAGPVAWRKLPSWYLVSTNDQIISPDLERWMAGRIGATVQEVPSSHASLVSHPDAVVALITEAAQAHER